ncbi:MAG: DUF2934 domain-containing protein [Chlorobiaceae bacterium]
MEENVKENATPQVSEDEIRLTAYYLWQEKGCKDGCDVDDWLEAEKICKGPECETKSSDE